MRMMDLTTPRLSTVLLIALAGALTLAGAPARAQTIHIVDTQPDFDNLAVTDGDKVVFRGPGPFLGTINLVGLQDVALVAANEPAFVGHGSVGISGIALVNAAVPTIDAGMSGSCLTIDQSQRVRFVGLRCRAQIGVHVINSVDVQVLGNEFHVVDGGVRVDNGLRAVVASNQINPYSSASTIHAFGIAIVGGLDNVAFDNFILNGLDTGIMVQGSAKRTALINNHVDGLPPAFGIWDDGLNSCLLRNTADGDVHPFLIGCNSTLIGNFGHPTGNSMVCASSALVENSM